MSGGEYTHRYLALHAAVFVVFYALFQWFVPSLWAEELTALSSSAAMNALGMASSYGVEGGLVSLSLTGGVRPVHVYIIRECSAIHVLGVILGLVVPLRAPWSRKAAGAALGSALIYVMNVARVIATVALTGYDVPPFTWLVTSPTVETYHYPISFLFGVAGVAATILAVDRLALPELGDFLAKLPENLISILRKTG
jgi:exosortase/archaeosortase family protein